MRTHNILLWVIYAEKYVWIIVRGVDVAPTDSLLIYLFIYFFSLSIASISNEDTVLHGIQKKKKTNNIERWQSQNFLISLSTELVF